MTMSPADKKAQAARCPCGGADDMCPCQNRPDAVTLRGIALQRIIEEVRVAMETATTGTILEIPFEPVTQR